MPAQRRSGIPSVHQHLSSLIALQGVNSGCLKLSGNRCKASRGAAGPNSIREDPGGPVRQGRRERRAVPAVSIRAPVMYFDHGDGYGKCFDDENGDRHQGTDRVEGPLANRGARLSST
jgi:hypothetical protein